MKKERWGFAAKAKGTARVNTNSLSRNGVLIGVDCEWSEPLTIKGRVWRALRKSMTLNINGVEIYVSLDPADATRIGRALAKRRAYLRPL